MSQGLQLEQLFQRCDTTNSGHIGIREFQDLCQEFGIEEGDSDIIFADLDHDGDGKINFEDFSFGFRDFLTPGSRRGSIQLGLLPMHPGPGGERGGALQDEEIQPRQRDMEIKHQRAQAAWRNFADNMGKDNIRRFLATSGDKMLTLFEELKGSDASPELVQGFEDALSSLIKDVKNIECEHNRMEDMFNKERESHSAHLASIEAEMDHQVARVEAAAREQAKVDFEAERKAMQVKMEAEVQELQTHLKLFQKVDQWMNKDEQMDNEARKKLDDANQENLQLKTLLAETQTNIAVLRSDMSQVKNTYESKVNELTNEKESMMEYVYQYDNLQRQLQLLQDANRKLQDTNDHMQSMVDMPAIALNSPRLNIRRELALGLGPKPISKDSPTPTGDGLGGELVKLERMFRPGKESRSPSEFGGSLADSDSLRSRESHRPKLSEVKFGIKRLMEDLDSGQGGEEEFENIYFRSPSTLEAELEGAQVADSFIEDAGLNEEDEEGRDEEIEVIGRRRKLTISERSLPSFRKSFVDVRGYEPDGQGGRRRQTQSLHLPARHHLRLDMGVVEQARERRDLEPTGPPDRTYKVVFAGDAAVGKTSFINRITKGVFMSNLSSTLGVDFQVKTIRVDDRNIAIQLWDTAGQERFRSVTKTYFRRADGVMLLYDVTSDRSFCAVRHWVNSIDEVSEKRIPIILCGNKVDQRTAGQAEGRRCVGAEDGEKMAREYSAIFMETSSKDGRNILDSLVMLAREMCASEDVEVQTSALKIRDDSAKKNCCSSSSRRSSIR